MEKDEIPPITKLVPNLWRMIYSFLSAKDLCRVQMVSKIFAKNATNDFRKSSSLWKLIKTRFKNLFFFF